MATLSELRSRMTAVQAAVLDGMLAGEADLARWQSALDGMARRVTLQTLATSLALHGSGSVRPVIGDELAQAIGVGASASAASIVETYNLAAAQAILAYGEVAEDASIDDYRQVLLGDTAAAVVPGGRNWASLRGVWKMPQISMAETAVTLNLAVELFYRNNPDLDGEADLLPYYAVCPVCQAGIDNNPYASIEAVNNAGPWPAHIQCIHYPELRAPRMAVDSSEVWRGE